MELAVDNHSCVCRASLSVLLENPDVLWYPLYDAASKWHRKKTEETEEK